MTKVSTNACLFCFLFLITCFRISDAIVEMVDNEGNPMSNQYYNPGSEIELACIIRNRSLWSTEVKWLKDDEPVDLHHSPSVR